MSVTKYCPKCNGIITVADRYDNSAPFRLYGKSCSCLPDNGSKGWPEDCQSMHERINDLEKWMSLLIESIPQSSSPSGNEEKNYVCDSLYQDLNPSVRFMDCIRNEVVNRAVQNGVQKEEGKIVWLRLCNYCGDVSKDSTVVKASPDDPDIDIGNNRRCWKCEEVLQEHPRLYEWMTKIIQWRFKVDAWTPKKPSFDQVRVDPPPPPPPLPGKNIIV